jgi:hypothetical protein
MKENTAFLGWFFELIGEEFPLPLFHWELTSVDKLLWASLSLPPKSLQGLPHQLLIKDIEHPYRVYGYWGYGINGYAFYSTRVEPNIRVTLRSEFGGIGTRSSQHAEHVVDLLKKTEAVASYLRRFCSVEINENLGDISVKLKTDRLQVDLRGVHSEQFWRNVVELGEGL